MTCHSKYHFHYTAESHTHTYTHRAQCSCSVKTQSHTHFKDVSHLRSRRQLLHTPNKHLTFNSHTNTHIHTQIHAQTQTHTCTDTNMHAQTQTRTHTHTYLLKMLLAVASTPLMVATSPPASSFCTSSGSRVGLHNATQTWVGMWCDQATTRCHNHTKQNRPPLIRLQLGVTIIPCRLESL